MECSKRCAASTRRWTRSRWACRRISNWPSGKAPRWCGSGRRCSGPGSVSGESWATSGSPRIRFVLRLTLPHRLITCIAMTTTADRSPLAVHSATTFIGGGNMARSLIGALIGHGADATTIAVAEPRADARDELARDFGVRTFSDNADAVVGAGCVVLAVKPQMMRKVCEQLAEPLPDTRE